MQEKHFYKLMVSFATIFKSLTSPLSSVTVRETFPTYIWFSSSIQCTILPSRSHSNYSNSKKEQLFVDLMVVVTQITQCIIATQGKKHHIPNRQKNHNFRAKSINTHLTPNHSQAYFLSATLPSQVNANYFQNPQ